MAAFLKIFVEMPGQIDNLDIPVGLPMLKSCNIEDLFCAVAVATCTDVQGCHHLSVQGNIYLHQFFELRGTTTTKKLNTR
eukprot:1161387-Pelagomonas_calceolata.AAC.3